jgi:hypothetical protein
MIAAMEEPIKKGSRPIVVNLPLTAMVVRKPKRFVSAAVTERDLVGLNRVLAPKGVQIRSECRHSACQGTCTLQHGAGQRTVFWREPVKPGHPRGRGVGGGGLKISLRVGPPGGTLR